MGVSAQNYTFLDKNVQTKSFRTIFQKFSMGNCQLPYCLNASHAGTHTG